MRFLGAAPSDPGDLVTKSYSDSGTQTLTGKTLTSPKVDQLNDTNGAAALVVSPTASAVNYLQIAGTAAGAGGPSLASLGADANVALNLYSKGGGSVNLRSAQNGIVLSAAPVTGGVNYVQVTSGATGVPPSISGAGSDTNVALWLAAKGTGAVSLFSGSSRGMAVSAPASGVNYLEVTGAATGGAVQVFGQGSDADVPIIFRPKGTNGYVGLSPNNTNALQVRGSSTPVNYFRLYSANTGTDCELNVTGSDANVSMNLTTRGTGVVKANGVQVDTVSGAATLTNKTISGASNTLSNIPVAAIAATGTASSTTYLRGDGTWATPAGGGGGSTATGMLEPVQAHTNGTETFTIVGGSVTQIAGREIQFRWMNVGDRILVMNAPASSGTGAAYQKNTQPANGIYEVIAAGTDLTVARTADFSGSVDPTGLSVYSANAGGDWNVGAVFTVYDPWDPGTFVWGTDPIQFMATSGRNLAPNSLYVGNGELGMWNDTPGVSTYLRVNPAATAEQTILMPAASSGTLATEAYVLANSGGGSQEIFVQQTAPPATGGPAIWYQTDGSGNIIGKKVRV